MMMSSCRPLLAWPVRYGVARSMFVRRMGHNKSVHCVVQDSSSARLYTSQSVKDAFNHGSSGQGQSAQQQQQPPTPKIKKPVDISRADPKHIDLYVRLGVKRNSSAETIRLHYRALAKKYHPDISKEENATETFQRIKDAYETLSDDTKRDFYNSTGKSASDPQQFTSIKDILRHRKVQTNLMALVIYLGSLVLFYWVAWKALWKWERGSLTRSFVIAVFLTDVCRRNILVSFPVIFYCYRNNLLQF